MRMTEEQLDQLEELLTLALSDTTLSSRRVQTLRGQGKTRHGSNLRRALDAIEAEKEARSQYRDQLEAYAGVADELTGDLTLADLDSRYVDEARVAAAAHNLSWPPTEAWEDEWRDAHARLDRLQRLGH